jgi:RNA polymerase sigma factor (sigma-70 family)
MTSQRHREHELAEFFSAHARRLHRAVTRHARGICHATIEDACQTAWTRLVRRDDISLDERGLSWLITVAIHEAHELGWRERTEAPAGTFLPSASDTELPEPIADGRDVDDQVAARIQLAERRDDIRQLKPQERRALFLKGMGYSYAEIMTLTGATYTAVNRRITEGRAELRRSERERAEPQAH